MQIHDTIALKIIREQELVIGPLAWTEAKKIADLHADAAGGSVSVSGEDPKATVDKLVAQYERLFGPASQEVCKDAVAGILKDMRTDEIPASLK